HCLSQPSGVPPTSQATTMTSFDTDAVLARSRTPALFSSSTRHGFMPGCVVALCASLFVFASPNYAQTTTTSGPVATTTATNVAEGGSIRPFKVQVPQAALDDLRRRIAATRWPDRETVTDPSQGVQLGKLQALVRYWGTDYDWRKAEAKLNGLPQFIT